MGEVSDPGMTWQTPAEDMPNELRERILGPHYKLGTAHGVAGVVGALGLICQVVEHAAARALLDRAVAWLLAQRCTDEAERPRFPWRVGGGERPILPRQAWCIGDIGVAAALLLAARACEREDWEEIAVGVARAVARTSRADQVDDPGLCHGAAGIGHIFNRMHQATGDQELAEAARYWFDLALGMRQPGRGIAGFFARTAEPGSTPEVAPPSGFLDGAAGVALALLAATGEGEPEWDRALLTSIPPR